MQVRLELLADTAGLAVGNVFGPANAIAVKGKFISHEGAQSTLHLANQYLSIGRRWKRLNIRSHSRNQLGGSAVQSERTTIYSKHVNGWPS